MHSNVLLDLITQLERVFSRCLRQERHSYEKKCLEVFAMEIAPCFLQSIFSEVEIKTRTASVLEHLYVFLHSISSKFILYK